MSKTAVLSHSNAVFMGYEILLDEEGKKTDKIQLHFLADEYLPDLDFLIDAPAIVQNNKGKKIKPNLKFKLSVDELHDLGLVIDTYYCVEYASEVSSFDGDKGKIAFSRKWFRSATPVV